MTTLPLLVVLGLIGLALELGLVLVWQYDSWQLEKQQHA